MDLRSDAQVYRYQRVVSQLGTVWIRFNVNIVIAGLVPVIHRGATVIYPDSSTLVEPWIAGTSPAMTGWGKVK